VENEIGRRHSSAVVQLANDLDVPLGALLIERMRAITPDS